jgi:hypothetical protein
MDTKTQHGYLILADISGYSSFVAKSELEHAHDILSELLELILNRLTAIFALSKLEGYAIFAYAPEEKLARGETLLEMIGPRMLPSKINKKPFDAEPLVNAMPAATSRRSI